MSLLVPDYIDRDIPLTGGERKAIRKEAWKLWMKDWRNVLIYLALVAVTIGLPMLQMLPIWWRFVTAFIGWGWGLLLLMTANAAVLYVGFTLLQRFRFAPLVRRVLRQYGYRVCIKCGYWLRGLATDAERCPECGITLPTKCIKCGYWLRGLATDAERCPECGITLPTKGSNP